MDHRAPIIALTAALAVAGCTGETTPLVTVEAPRDGGCLVDETPRTYQVYFVIDVSGSMVRFLEDLASQLQAFAASFPETDSQDTPVFVEYYVVAFVNDVRWFPDGLSRRMTSPIAVQGAFEQAIEAGANEQNLTRQVRNAETEENLLDALQSVVDADPAADVIQVIIATDAPFAEAPTVLSTNLPVFSTYPQVAAGLERIGAEVHVFTKEQLDGLTRNYNGMPPLTSEGSTINDLDDLAESRDLILSALANIADRSNCN
ncbi:MAG: hypothetical protein RMA76_00130 [Deltaproteobacteria bacterium]